jgi:uncharacterized membrane protein YgcG
MGLGKGIALCVYASSVRASRDCAGVFGKRLVQCKKKKTDLKAKQWVACTERLGQQQKSPVNFAHRDGTAILCTPIWILWCLETVCVAPISSAILWTHFVTPRGDQTQQDQTNHFSYCKKGKSLERVGMGFCSGPVETSGTSLMLGGLSFCMKVENYIEYAFCA